MPGKSYDFDKMVAYGFSNINVHTDNTSSDNCYGSCNDYSCDIDCDCVCDSKWGWESFEREATKEKEIVLARSEAKEIEYSKKQSKDKTIKDKLDGMSEEELLNIIQLATQALAKKQTEKRTSR